MPETGVRPQRAGQRAVWLFFHNAGLALLPGCGLSGCPRAGGSEKILTVLVPSGCRAPRLWLIIEQWACLPVFLKCCCE